MQETTHENLPDIQSNRYRVLEVLGTGAVGTVYRAEDLRLGITVAIKKLNRSADDSEAVRFQREAKLAGALRHPNVLTVFDFGLTDKHEPYLVLSFVEGQNLGDRILQPDEILLPEALDIFIQIARGLSHAHSKNVVHRDIKPTNIMLLSDPPTEGERVKIVDFGMAKSNLDKQELTQVGVGLGTPLYMSPEQAEGKEVDARSDLYALGSIMFEVLVGEPPFIADSIFELIALKLEGEISSVSEYSRYEIPAQLEEIIERCLRSNPDDRYSTAAELLRDLEQLRAETFALPNKVLDISLDPHVAKRFEWRPVLGVVIILLFVGAGLFPLVHFVLKPEEEQVDDKFFVPMNKNSNYLEAKDLTDSTLKDFIAARKDRKLEELTFTDSKITPAGYRQLDKCKLSALTLKRGDVSRAILESLSKIQSLDTVRLEDNSSIDVEGLKLLAHLPHLGEIALQNQGCLTAAHVEALDSLPDLNRVEIRECSSQITGGFKNWSSMKRLRTLYIDSAQVYDNDIACLVPFRIDHLSLGASLITPKAVDSLIKMRNLKKVDIAETLSVKDSDFDRLRRRNPPVQVKCVRLPKTPLSTEL